MNSRRILVVRQLRDAPHQHQLTLSHPDRLNQELLDGEAGLLHHQLRRPRCGEQHLLHLHQLHNGGLQRFRRMVSGINLLHLPLQAMEDLLRLAMIVLHHLELRHLINALPLHQGIRKGKHGGMLMIENV
jgi:hypothetical protein